MSDYQKLVLEDLPKSSVVNSNAYAAEEEQVNELINSAVSKALNANLSTEENDNIEKQPINDGPSAEAASDNILSNSAFNINKGQEPSFLPDIEVIKKEEYEKGIADTVAKYQPLLDSASTDVKFTMSLQEKFNLIVPTQALDTEISKVSAEAISSIAKKLHLVLPANFEEIIITGLVSKLKKFYKEGEITLTINPAKYDFCKELLQSDSIPDRFKDNFHLVRDSKIGLDDCTLEWQDTRLEYNQEQLSEEIDKIIEQLKTAG